MRWRYRHTVLALATLAFFATMVARLAISPVVPTIAGAFDVSTAAMGLALSGMWAAYALVQFPSGVLGDRFGERRVILAAVGLTAVAGLALAFAPSYPAFAALVVALGVAAGLHYTVATTFLSRQFSDLGRAIGVHVAGGPLAGLLAPIAVTAIVARYDWRIALLVGPAVAVPVLVAFAWRIDRTPPPLPDQRLRERFAIGPLSALLGRPPIAFTTALAIGGAFTWQATASFLPTFLVVHHGLPTPVAGLLFSVYFVVHGTTQPVMGWLSDRAGRDVAVAAAMGLGVVAYVTLLTAPGWWTILGGVCLAGVAMSWGAPLQSRFIDHLDAAERGAGFGLVRTVYMLCGASGSVVVGTLADGFGWPVAMGLLAAIMAGGFIAIAANRTAGIGL